MTQNIFSDISQLNSHVDQGMGIIIGNFDGVHLGHKHLLDNFIQKCTKDGLLPIALTFKPHPYLFLNKASRNFLICDYLTRNDLLLKNGIKKIIELDFNSKVQSLSPQVFFDHYLFKLKNLNLIYLGHDFSLGQGKVQARSILEDKAKGLGIKVLESKPFQINSKTISSSYIRELLISGDIKIVNESLGRKYSLTGNIVNGYGVGKKDLVPTANIEINETQVYPKKGVYFTKTTYQGAVYDSITNIGIRPSLKDDNGLSIETNIFNFSKKIYQQEVTIEFLKFHREEIKFNTKEDLLAQIHVDIKSRQDFHD